MNLKKDTQSSLDIERKFTDVIKCEEWEVETENGWANISSVNKTIPYALFNVEFDNGQVIGCADTHIFIDEDHNEVFAKDSLGASIITKNGISKVTKISQCAGKEEEMYDLTIDSPEHTYFTSGILSHNSTVTAACVLWYLIFQELKTVCILANKGATAREILGRVQNMYQALPKWMQVGVTSWNKGSFSLANGCACMAASTSSSAIRGCLAGNTALRVKENDSEREVTIAELFGILESDGENAAKNARGILIEAPNGWVTFDAVVRYEYDKFLFVETDNGNITASENHPLYTSEGWKRADKLKVGDVLIKKNGQAKITKIVEKKENAFLYDIVNAGNSDKEDAVELHLDYFKI